MVGIRRVMQEYQEIVGEKRKEYIVAYHRISDVVYGWESRLPKEEEEVGFIGDTIKFRFNKDRRESVVVRDITENLARWARARSNIKDFVNRYSKIGVSRSDLFDIYIKRPSAEIAIVETGSANPGPKFELAGVYSFADIEMGNAYIKL